MHFCAPLQLSLAVGMTISHLIDEIPESLRTKWFVEVTEQGNRASGVQLWLA